MIWPALNEDFYLGTDYITINYHIDYTLLVDTLYFTIAKHLVQLKHQK